MDFILESISVTLAENIIFAPLLAFLAGLLTSFTPCSLTNVTLVVGYVGGSGQKQAFGLSVIFALGSALTFTALGGIASIAGGLIGNTSSWFYFILGTLMIAMALQTWEIYEFIPSSYLVSKNTKRGLLGAFIAGILAGLFSSPCSTPVLIVLLGIVAGEGDFIRGILLLLLYSLGHGILTVIAGTSTGFVKKLSRSEKYAKWSDFLKNVMGLLIIFVGFYLFYLGF